MCGFFRFSLLLLLLLFVTRLCFAFVPADDGFYVLFFVYRKNKVRIRVVNTACIVCKCAASGLLAEKRHSETIDAAFVKS